MTIQLDMIGITVSDMEASLRFYRLLEVPIPEGVADQPHVEAITPNGYRIAWDTEAMMKSIYPDWVQPVGQRVTLAFKCDSPAAVDALYQRILDHGYQGYKAPWDAFWGQRYTVVRDPDGNLVDLFAPL